MTLAMPGGDHHRPLAAALGFCATWLAAIGVAAQEPLPPAPIETVAPPTAGETAVDRIAAVADPVVITYCELDLEARVAAVLGGDWTAALAPPGDELKLAVLKYVLGQELILGEAAALQIFDLHLDNLEQEATSFRARFPTDAGYHRFLQAAQAEEADVKRILERNLRVERFLDYRVRAEVRLGDADVRKFYDEHRERFGAAPFDQLRASIRVYLRNEAEKKFKQEWMEKLFAHRAARILWKPGAAAPLCLRAGAAGKKP